MKRTWQQPVRWSLGALALTVGLVIAGSVILAENALHVPSSARIHADDGVATEITRGQNAAWESLEIYGANHVALRGWLFKPERTTRAAVILLHGVADTRAGVRGQARMLLGHGYAVLTPDSRGHGESDGAIITYGVKEADDVRRWARWMSGEQRFGEIYGLGESMGAANLLQAIGQPTPFLAVVAECPFLSFEQIGFYRLQRASGLGELLLWPFVRTAFAYTRARYGVDLDHAAPATAALGFSAPVLLIHGTADTNIPP